MPRVEDYAMIGDLQTAALIGRDGSIDWCCFPRFDSGACFARLLGDSDHGRWLLAPASGITSATRRYRSDTLILESIYECAEGRVRAIDFMPPRGEAPDIVRIVESLDGDGADAVGAGDPLRLRQHRAVGAAGRPRPRGGRGPGRAVLAQPTHPSAVRT